MKVSVLFATYNGEKTLPVMFDAMTRVNLPQGGVEFVAVDNGSTDRSAEILASFSDRLDIKVVTAPERGKNRALNKGLEQVSGEIVVLTDDDIIPDPDWLVKMDACLQEHSSYAVFGGRIKPNWPGELPAYVEKHIPMGMVFAITEAQQPDGPVDPQLVWGPNMAVRREVFDQGFRFNENVGPASGNYIMGSETEFTSRLVANGFSCYFSNEPVVEHIIRENQLTKAWLWGRSIRSGRALCLNNLENHRCEYKTVFGVPIWIFNRCISDYATYLLYSLIGRGDSAFGKRFSASRWYGYIVQVFNG